MTLRTKVTTTRTANSTAEQLIKAGPCILYGIYPELTTTGTITIRDGGVADASGTIDHVAAIGLTQAGKSFGTFGVYMEKGITVQQSVGTDQMAVVWEPCE